MKICIQAGHINIQYNSDPQLRNGTGAPGEQEFTLRIANRLSEILRTKGFAVNQTDANSNSDPNVTNNDWDLFLAIHYDANVYGIGGGCISAPDPSVDASNAESKRIATIIEQSYFSPYIQDTGIVDHPERINNNMTLYYMWNVLTAKTPCALIECGVGGDAHDSVILADTERVCNAIAKGICKAFNVLWEPVVPPTPPTPPVAPPATNPGPSTTTTTTPTVPPVITPVNPCSTQNALITKLLADRVATNAIASKFHWFYQSDFNAIKKLSS